MNKKRNAALIRLGISAPICLASFIALKAQMGGPTTGMIFPEPGVVLALLGLGVSGICILIFGFQAWLN
jgi:hypothetical protein